MSADGVGAGESDGGGLAAVALNARTLKAAAAPRPARARSDRNFVLPVIMS